ncbi:hypothetical protein COY87_03950 [Candidatus Roizmanbacteria bacterium CG_4_10_14_0_8_um_filter_33_9]|uniref:Polymerase beta nucleotidyltransferase domain-containing protein n=1 Tax=Candidatus Roizmanbacteria bacterium CG_4_10_14_0_8_um_filter_33_9 TaxID=1974826 RepID=A0A2M7QHR3_9BACT|nr:MAG: hypothetical protein COY87_03950 [Candidatus Roizmanbacteria bacterium CG_4_10_14_0_8_um_filter_33_9]
MNQLSNTIVSILQKYHIKKAAFFGSYARGDFDEKSDIDILFQPPDDMGIGVVSLKRDLESALEKKVDLVSYNGISKYLKEYILGNQKPLL